MGRKNLIATAYSNQTYFHLMDQPILLCDRRFMYCRYLYCLRLLSISQYYILESRTRIRLHICEASSLMRLNHRYSANFMQ